MNASSLPDKFWHCSVSVQGRKAAEHSVVNDLTRERLLKDIVEPWHAGRPFTIGGRIIRRKDEASHIQIAHTPEPQEAYSQRHYASMQASGIADMVTDTRYLPLSEGTDYTSDLLFAELRPELPSADDQLVITLCQRVPAAARILSNRRMDKPGFKLTDEYDVQDFIHALIRAYVKYSVQEDPIGKIAASRSSRADIAIEDIGVLIEVKFVRSPDDQKQIVKDFSEDLVLYTKWAPLRTLVYVIYNSGDLSDPEALVKLDGRKEIAGKVFHSKMVLI